MRQASENVLAFPGMLDCPCDNAVAHGGKLRIEHQLSSRRMTRRVGFPNAPSRFERSIRRRWTVTAAKWHTDDGQRGQLVALSEAPTAVTSPRSPLTSKQPQKSTQPAASCVEEWLNAELRTYSQRGLSSGGGRPYAEKSKGRSQGSNH